jgi:hypothetical protein
MTNTLTLTARLRALSRVVLMVVFFISVRDFLFLQFVQ